MQNIKRISPQAKKLHESSFSDHPSRFKTAYVDEGNIIE